MKKISVPSFGTLTPQRFDDIFAQRSRRLFSITSSDMEEMDLDIEPVQPSKFLKRMDAKLGQEPEKRINIGFEDE